MGAKGAVEVLFRRKLAEEEDPEAAALEAERHYEETFLTPDQATGRGFVDAVIEPAETRRKLARFLLRLETKEVAQPTRKHGNIPT